MRRSLLSSFTAPLVLFAAATASAGTLTMASWFQVTEGVPMTRTMAQLGPALGSSTATSIAVELSYPAVAFSHFIPKTAMGVIDLHVSITQGGPQAITATPSMAVADRGVPGTVIFKTAFHATMGVNQSGLEAGVNTLLRIPINIGVSAQFTSTFLVIGITHTLRVDFYGWTPHTKTITLPSSGTGSVVTAMGSFNLDAAGAGTVTLVSPTRIHLGGPLAQRDSVSITTLKLNFVPEPGTLLLLGAGLSALGLVWRRSGGAR